MKIGSGGRRGRFFAEIDLMTSGPPELLLEWARMGSDPLRGELVRAAGTSDITHPLILEPSAPSIPC